MQPHGILLVTGPTGSRQDDHALHGARPAQPARRQDPHRRGSGRVPDGRHQPDPGQAADRPHVRQRAALDPAAGPGRHHDRRDPRPRDRADRRAVGADRPPGAVDPAHQRRARRRSTGCSTWASRTTCSPRRSIGILAQRLVRTLCPDCKEPYHRAAGGRRPDGPAQVRAAGRHHALSRQGLRAVLATPASSGASASSRC